MNRRQKLKKLKQDNELMRNIINRTPEMKWLYDVYNQPLNINHYTMDFEKRCFARTIPPYMTDISDYEGHVKRALIRDIAEEIKDDIKFETVDIGRTKEVRATLYVGKARD